MIRVIDASFFSMERWTDSLENIVVVSVLISSLKKDGCAAGWLYDLHLFVVSRCELLIPDHHGTNLIAAISVTGIGDTFTIG